MENIKEIRRLSSPAPRPQSLASDGTYLWMGSMETKKIYQIDPIEWKVLWQVDAPGTPFGIAVVGEELRVLCGETEEDFRIIRRCIPGHGFDTVFKLPCPDDTGSQLGYDGSKLHISQWYNKRVLALGEDGQVEEEFESPHGIAGQVIIGSKIYLATTDAEETDEYFLTRLDSSEEISKAEDIAAISFGARALAFDGENFWTNHREAHEIVCFQKPD